MVLFRDKLLSYPSTISTEDLRGIVLAIISQTDEKEYWQSVLTSLTGNSMHQSSSLSRGVLIWLKSYSAESTRNSRPSTASSLRDRKYVTAEGRSGSVTPPSQIKTNDDQITSSQGPSQLLLASLKQRVADLESSLAKKHTEFSEYRKSSEGQAASLKVDLEQSKSEVITLRNTLNTIKGREEISRKRVGEFGIQTDPIKPAPIVQPDEQPANLASAASRALVENLQFEVQSLRSQLITLEAQKADADMEIRTLKTIRKSGVEVGLVDRAGSLRGSLKEKSVSRPISAGHPLASLPPSLPRPSSGGLRILQSVPPLNEFGRPATPLPSPTASRVSVGIPIGEAFFAADRRLSKPKKRSSARSDSGNCAQQ